MLCGGMVNNIRYILYIDPAGYDAIRDPAVKKVLGRIVGNINAHPDIAEGKIIMMGPGRWGSSNIDLGVNVGYADIDNAPVLVEMAREAAGHVPEVSYGTHFFLDLVEGEVIYLPVYPDDPKASFNQSFFTTAANRLETIVPAAGELSSIIRLIDIPEAFEGRKAQIVADPHNQRALCYLA